MGHAQRHVFAAAVLIALATSQPVFSKAAIEHGRLIVRLPQRASWSVVLPDAERRLLMMVNHIRQTHGLSPLIPDPSLRAAARRHSRDMALRGYVGHATLTGQTFRERMAGLVHPGTRISENVAAVQTIEEGHGAFVASPAHLRNMLDPAFHRIGIGVATAGEDGVMITEDFV